MRGVLEEEDDKEDEELLEEEGGVGGGGGGAQITCVWTVLLVYGGKMLDGVPVTVAVLFNVAQTFAVAWNTRVNVFVSPTQSMESIRKVQPPNAQAWNGWQ